MEIEPHQGSSGWNDVPCDRSDRGGFVCKKSFDTQTCKCKSLNSLVFLVLTGSDVKLVPPDGLCFKENATNISMR